MVTNKEFHTYERISGNVVRNGISCLRGFLNLAEYKDELEMLDMASELLYKVEMALRRKHESDF